MFGRFLAFLAAVSAGAAASAEPRQPTGKWVVNFADAQCIATRNYGSEKDPLVLVLKAPAIGGLLQIGIVRNGWKATATQAEERSFSTTRTPSGPAFWNMEAKGSAH
jgi:hypothetical protein